MYIRKYKLEWLQMPEFLITPKSVKEMKKGETFKPKYVEYSIDICHAYIFEEIIKGKTYQKAIGIPMSGIDEQIDKVLNHIQKEFDEVSGV